MDVSRELNEADAAYYQSLIGILRWMVELGRVDVCLEVSMMSSHLALPREGHLEQVLHIFAYLKKYHNTELVYDPSDPVVDENDFEQRDWVSSEFGHVEGKEEFPVNMPEPRGHGFIIRVKVDADHASDTVSRRSRTGLLIYLNCALVYWWSKKQTSVESSSFGSEELSKTMDAPAPVHLKEMYKLIRFVLSTKNDGLKFELMKDMKKWSLKALSDSDFASDKETRISIIGYIIYFCGIPIA